MRKKDLEEKNNNIKMDDVYLEAPSVEVHHPVPATPALRHADPGFAAIAATAVYILL
jgi:hypothetical protein